MGRPAGAQGTSPLSLRAPRTAGPGGCPDCQGLKAAKLHQGHTLLCKSSYDFAEQVEKGTSHILSPCGITDNNAILDPHGPGSGHLCVLTEKNIRGSHARPARLSRHLQSPVLRNCVTVTCLEFSGQRDQIVQGRPGTCCHGECQVMAGHSLLLFPWSLILCRSAAHTSEMGSPGRYWGYTGADMVARPWETQLFQKPFQ